MYCARGISVRASGKILLEGVDLSLEAGKVIAVVGPNGAGKSTLLKAMTGEQRIAAGEIKLDGQLLTNWSPAELAQRRAVLPQSIDVVFPFLVNEIVTLGARTDLSTQERGHLVQRALDAVELSNLSTRIYGTLSGGEKQRVQLARVLAQVWSCNCTYLMLDEPTASLDLAHQILILRLARQHAENGGSVLMVLHDLNLAAMVADKLIALKNGRHIVAGTPQEVMHDELIAALYGVRMRVRGVPDGPFLLPQTAEIAIRGI